MKYKVKNLHIAEDGFGFSIRSGNEEFAHTSDYTDNNHDAEERAEFIKHACECHYGLLDALNDFQKVAAQAKPNCGPKLRALIQAAQEKHSNVLQRGGLRT